MERQWRKFDKQLKIDDGFGWNKNGGPYIIPAKCFLCRPEPCSLDRVFVVTSIGDNHDQISPPPIR